MTGRRLRTFGPLLALLVTLALLAAACGGGGSSKKSAEDNGKKVGGDTGEGITSPSKSPKNGGKLIMGLEADVDGFRPDANRWDISGLTIASSVFDPLGAYGADGKVHPYLAKSFDPSPDYKDWKITLRPGIKFHNGEPFNADAVKANIDATRSAALTGAAFVNIASVDKVDDMTVSIKMKQPWVAFPQYLTAQVGYMAAPAQLKDPNGPRHPIGTGPFIYKEWVPGNHFTAVKNPDYWQKGLPHLDQIEFRAIIDPRSRYQSLKSGTIDILHTQEPDTIIEMRKDSSIKRVEDDAGEQEEGMMMLNTKRPPTDDIRVRQALAYALDAKRVIDVISHGIVKQADGPFSTDSKWYTPTGYPKYDLAKAKKLVAAYEKDTGKKIVFDYGTVNTPQTLRINQLIKDMWKQAGITANIKQFEQATYISRAVLGDFQVNAWRQFGAPDPDGEYVWWHSTSAKPIGTLSLNIPRNSDPQIDTALDDARSNPDQAARKRDYAVITKRQAQDLPYLWISHSLWVIAFKPEVKDAVAPVLPDGAKGLAPVAGRFPVVQLWVDK